MCREEDRDKLHGVLKYKMPQNIMVKKKTQSIEDLFNYVPTKPELTHE